MAASTLISSHSPNPPLKRKSQNTPEESEGQNLNQSICTINTEFNDLSPRKKIGKFLLNERRSHGDINCYRNRYLLARDSNLSKTVYGSFMNLAEIKKKLNYFSATKLTNLPGISGLVNIEKAEIMIYSKPRATLLMLVGSLLLTWLPCMVAVLYYTVVYINMTYSNILSILRETRKKIVQKLSTFIS